MTTFQTPGPEAWHPNPAFLFQHGAGPLFDMGPYYITALVQTFGSVRKVAAVGSKARDVRVIGSGPRAGEEFAVEVPTHVSAMAQFDGGASSHSVFSFESPRQRMGFVEITGTEATISLPDPNFFDGDIRLWRAGDEEWTIIPASGPANGRGMGVLDMARSIRAGVPHRATGQLGYHVLDTLVAVYGRAVLLAVRHGECGLAVECDPVSRPLDEGGIGRRNTTIRPGLGRARCGPQAQRLVEHADRRRSGFGVALHDPGREDRNSLDCLLLKHEHPAGAFSDGRQIDVLRNLDQRRRCHPLDESGADK